MCELVISLDDSSYWKKGWELGDTNKKTPKEICQMIREGMNECSWFKTFSYDRVLITMPNGSVLVARDKDGKIRLRHKKKKKKMKRIKGMKGKKIIAI
jgi:hypothetical protein